MENIRSPKPIFSAVHVKAKSGNQPNAGNQTKSINSIISPSGMDLNIFGNLAGSLCINGLFYSTVGGGGVWVGTTGGVAVGTIGVDDVLTIGSMF